MLNSTLFYESGAMALNRENAWNQAVNYGTHGQPPEPAPLPS